MEVVKLIPLNRLLLETNSPFNKISKSSETGHKSQLMSHAVELVIASDAVQLFLEFVAV